MNIKVGENENPNKEEEMMHTIIKTTAKQNPACKVM